MGRKSNGIIVLSDNKTERAEGKDIINMTCIVCPLGCSLKVKASEPGEVKSVKVTGNRCLKGKEYGASEYINPVRMLTSTVSTRQGYYPVVPVRTSIPIPKDKIMECMDIIRGVCVNAPVKPGDVIIKNISNTGADVIATDSSESEEI